MKAGIKDGSPIERLMMLTEIGHFINRYIFQIDKAQENKSIDEDKDHTGNRKQAEKYVKVIDN